MRILLIHNHYRIRGGEDVVFANEAELLASNGHDVLTFTKDSRDIAGVSGMIRTAWSTSYSVSARQELYAFMRDAQIDIAHVHNFFPMLSPSIYDACRDAGVPVVQTLHNFRPICPGGLLMRNGRICEDCLQGSAYFSIAHRCYRGSALATAVSANMVEYHRRHASWSSKVDRFIAVSDFVKQKFIAGGFPQNRITVKPNVVHDRASEITDVPKPHGALFVGRLSPEKGISTMIDAWRQIDYPLTVAGDGPMSGVFGGGESEMNVRALGRLDHGQVLDQMSISAFVVMPSEWYETFGLNIAEAYSMSRPAIASNLGAMAEIVDDGKTGLLFTPGDSRDLVDKVSWAINHPAEMMEMGRRGREKYERLYSPQATYSRLIDIYNDILDSYVSNPDA